MKNQRTNFGCILLLISCLSSGCATCREEPLPRYAPLRAQKEPEAGNAFWEWAGEFLVNGFFSMLAGIK